LGLDQELLAVDPNRKARLVTVPRVAHRRTAARPAWRAAAGALAVLALAGCGLTSSGGSSASSDGPARAESVRSGRIDPASIPGLDVVSDGSGGSGCRYAVRYPVIPGAAALTTSMKAATRDRIGIFLAAGRDGAACDSDLPPEINIDFELVAASGDVVAVRLTTQDYRAAGSGLSTTAYWFDGATRSVSTGAALFTEESLGRLADLITERLAGGPGGGTYPYGDLGDDIETVLRDAAFTPDGALRIRFDRGAVAVPAAGEQEIEIARDDVTPLLSDFGLRAQRERVRPSDGLELGVTPGPEKTPADKPRTARVDCAKVKCVALTFDDGPGPDTRQLLEALAAHDARATFFLTGQNAGVYHRTVAAQVAAGHEVANHTWNHPDLTRRSAAEIRSQLARTDAAIEAAGGSAPTLMRPPYGAVNATVRREVTQPIVLWSVDTEDWKYKDSARVAEYTAKTVRPGDIVLLHDIHATSVAAVPTILETLAERGYHFVTVSELFDGRRLKPGVTYTANEDAYGR
jgi:peptidoglycan/xylan/chitin deacetylase (PgdA/CDA1 family)